MHLTELEIAVLRDRYTPHEQHTPETVARKLNLTLGEIREAEKTALRKLDDPEHIDPAGVRRLDLNEIERAVVLDLYCRRPAARTPEEIAERIGATLAEVLEAEKQAMSKLEDPEHASRESLAALGIAS